MLSSDNSGWDGVGVRYWWLKQLLALVLCGLGTVGSVGPLHMWLLEYSYQNFPSMQRTTPEIQDPALLSWEKWTPHTDRSSGPWGILGVGSGYGLSDQEEGVQWELWYWL